MEDLITFVNNHHLAIDSLKATNETLAERLRNTFVVVADNTEAINDFPLTYMTSEAFATNLADLEDRLSVISAITKKCEESLATVQRSSTSSPHYDNFDELSGAQLSYNVSANAIAATTDEISQADYANGTRPPKTVTAVLATKTRTELFRYFLSANYITGLAKALKTEYYNLTDIPRDQQPTELQLNVLCRGGEVVFNKLVTAFGTVLKTVRVGHSERLLDLRQRLVTMDVATAYDECLNAILAALLMKVTASTTKTSINALTLADEWLTKDGRALLLHLRCLLANYPAMDTDEYLNNVKALRVTESDDPMLIIESFRAQIQLHRIQYPLYSDTDAQKLFIEMLRESQKVARKKFETPLYHAIIEVYNRDARNENHGYPGGADALFKDVQTRWYTIGATHADYIRSGHHPSRANALTGEFRTNPKRPANDNRDKTPDRGGARGGAKDDPKKPTTAKFTDNRPRSPRRDAPVQDQIDYEKEMLRLAKAKHSGRDNKDTEVKGIWEGVRFTPTKPGDWMPCVTCYVVKKKTVHHSTGRAGCPCSLKERVVKFTVPGKTANSLSTRSSSPPTTKPTVKTDVPPPPTPTLEQMQKLFSPEQLNEISAALGQSTSAPSTSGGAQPQQPSINHLRDGGDSDHDDTYDEDFPAFQKTPPKMSWPITKSANPSVNVFSLPTAVPPSKHNRKKVQQGFYIPVPTPPGGDDFQPVSPDYSETTSEEADADDFQNVNPKKAWRPKPSIGHSVHVLSVNKFDTLSSAEDSDQSDHPPVRPLHSDVHSEDFSQPEAVNHLRQKIISAEKRVQRRLLKKQRKTRGPQEDDSWFVPVRPLRPQMKTKATQTVEKNDNKLPKAYITSVDTNPNENHEKTSHAASDDILGTGEVALSSIVVPQHVPPHDPPPPPSTPPCEAMDLHEPTNPTEVAISVPDLLMDPDQSIAAADTTPPSSSTPETYDFADLLPADFWSLNTNSTAPESAKTLRQTTSCHVAPGCTTWHSRHCVEDESPDIYILPGLVLALGLASRSATSKLHRTPPWDPLRTPLAPPREKDDIISFCGELPQSTRTLDQSISTSDLPHPPSTNPTATYASMVRTGGATTPMPLMGCYFAADLDSEQQEKAVAKVHFPTIDPAAVLDTMAKPIPTEDATTIFTPTSDTPGDFSRSSSASSDVQSRHEEPADFTFPIIENPECVSLITPKTQGFSPSEAAATPYEPSVDTETDRQPPSTSSWQSLMTDDAMDSWLRNHLALQAPRHIDMNATFLDDDVYSQGYCGHGRSTIH
ncbi:hypothetical protein CYMTET_55754 [Cymbomonas tetramitiformis]|uniref:Uncharacterized protein n=1 Tax=Cymbomonas tetramitiformis TaxID=36881 RepID=A0AAE0BE13_9CHLO|nr:hypothetical protein CYMTET_55754 [Cymbomonas tetramitiformis]